MQEEEKHIDIIEKLKNLPRIKTGDDFMQKLESRIIEFDSGKNISDSKSRNDYKEKEEGFFSKLLGAKRKQWLVPAMGLAVVAVFTLYITQFNKNEITKDNQDSQNSNNNEIKQSDSPDLNRNKAEEKPPVGIPEPTEQKTESDNKTERSATNSNQNKAGIKEVPPNPVESSRINIGKDNYKKENSDETPNSKKSTEESKGIIETEKMRGGRTSEVETENSGTMFKAESPAIDGKVNSSADELKDFERPIDQKLLDKLNAANKKKLDSLKKKMDK